MTRVYELTWFHDLAIRRESQILSWSKESGKIGDIWDNMKLD